MNLHKAMRKVNKQRLSNRSKDLSRRTLNLMEVIVAADEIYDEENGIDYDDTIDERAGA